MQKFIGSVSVASRGYMTPKSQKIRYREATQWIQAIVTFSILVLIYFMQGYFVSGQTPIDISPPGEMIEGSLQGALIYDDGATTIKRYYATSIPEVERSFEGDQNRSYTTLADDVIVMEGRLDSIRAQEALALLSNR